MKVTICARGKWHSFKLAEQLHRRCALQSIITGYPRFRLRGTTVPAEKIVSLPTIVAQEAVRRIPFVGWMLSARADYWNRLVFDQWATRFMLPADITVLWTTSGPGPIRRAKQLGACTVLECGAVHVGYLKKILKEEYDRLALPWREDRSVIFYPASVECELTEYDEADYLAVPSEFVRQSFLKKGTPGEKLLKAPYGTDCETFHPVRKQDDTFRVMYVGMVSVLKGIPVLLEAWRKLRWARGAELTLVGRLSPEMRQLPRPCEGTVRFLGGEEHRQLYRVYSQASVFVFPTLGDGWPLVVGEAMACGLPVICTTSSGACELVRDGIEGFVVPPREPEAIADRLTYLREHEDRRSEMAAAARRRAEEYSWTQYGDQVWENYSKVLSGCNNRATLAHV